MFVFFFHLQKPHDLSEERWVDKGLGEGRQKRMKELERSHFSMTMTALKISDEWEKSWRTECGLTYVSTLTRHRLTC